MRIVGYDEYELTEKGRQLWPAIHTLMAWGDEHCAPDGAPRLFEHAADGGRVGADGICSRCGQRPDPSDLQAVPGPGLPMTAGPADAATVALRRPHRLLEPVRAPA
jgi:hypothetical protein